MNKKNYEKIIQLNSIYTPLIKRAKKCQQILKDKNKISKFVWANNHYEEYNHEYICETYPIPVVEINGIGDIGFNITDCFYEGYFSKDKLLKFDLDILKIIDTFAMYGESDYLKDIYNSKMGNANIKQIIESSTEANIAISFTFRDKELESTIDLLIKLTSV